LISFITPLYRPLVKPLVRKPSVPRRKEATDMQVRPDFFRPRAFWIVEDEVVQGYVDLDDPENLDLEYTKVIATALDFLDFGNVVHIGGGGLMLPRYILSKWPHVLQTVFEPDEDMIEFIGKTLKTLEGFNVVPITGEEGLEKLPAKFTDLTIIDAFQGGVVPRTMMENGFFDHLYRTSRTAIFNTIQTVPIEIPVPRYEFKAMLAPESTLKGEELGNIIFLWSKDPLPIEQIRDKTSHTVTEIRE
jgi:hypothetical protein